MCGVRFRWAAFVAILAYASHAFLDAATTYGTQLFWPFSRYRVGLDIISIIDPLFTLLVLLGVLAGLRNRRPVAVLTLTLAVVWLATGFVQRERATAAQQALALSRSDSITRGAVFPTLGNTIVWRSIYESDGLFRIDRIHVPWFRDPAYAAVTAVSASTVKEAGSNPRMQRDFTRFAWFSDGWIARSPTDPTVIGDARYSLRTDRYEPVWGIRFHPDRRQPTEWVNRTRNREIDISGLWRDLLSDNAFRPIP